MKFKIDCTSSWFGEDVIENYPQLKNFDFTFEEREVPNIQLIRDENGKRIKQECGTKIIRTPKIELKTLEDLMKLVHDVGFPVIVDNADGCEIEIYDGYRE